MENAGMTMSVRLFHLETWATFVFTLIVVILLGVAYRRARVFGLLSLAIGNALFLAQLAAHYTFWLAAMAPPLIAQLAMTAMFFLASIFSVFGMAHLCRWVSGQAPQS
jgi:hypothetical protein